MAAGGGQGESSQTPWATATRPRPCAARLTAAPCPQDRTVPRGPGHTREPQAGTGPGVHVHRKQRTSRFSSQPAGAGFLRGVTRRPPPPRAGLLPAKLCWALAPGPGLLRRERCSSDGQRLPACPCLGDRAAGSGALPFLISSGSSGFESNDPKMDLPWAPAGASVMSRAPSGRERPWQMERSGH